MHSNCTFHGLPSAPNRKVCFVSFFARLNAPHASGVGATYLNRQSTQCRVPFCLLWFHFRTWPPRSHLNSFTILINIIATNKCANDGDGNIEMLGMAYLYV